MVPRRGNGCCSEISGGSGGDDTEQGEQKMANIDTLVEELGKLTVLEAVALVKQLEEQWGVSAAAPVGVAGPAAVAEAVEEKTEFDV
ncbi:MAG TPA: 50S ribosomal protein L7/L12, partial [Luteolibacter sp.]